MDLKILAKKQKYYVVWEGLTPGIYLSWEDCQKQIFGQAAAKYKAFDSMAEAEYARGSITSLFRRQVAKR